MHVFTFENLLIALELRSVLRKIKISLPRAQLLLSSNQNFFNLFTSSLFSFLEACIFYKNFWDCPHDMAIWIIKRINEIIKEMNGLRYQEQYYFLNYEGMLIVMH